MILKKATDKMLAKYASRNLNTLKGKWALAVLAKRAPKVLTKKKVDKKTKK
jgi:hypothetical protein